MASRISGREWIAAVGGLAAGITGGRLLPPLFAKAAGSIAGKERNPFERLKEDHRKVTNILDEMERTPDGHPVYRGKLFLQLKRALTKHAMAEEDVVYPLLRDEVHDVEQAKHLYSEHAEMKVHLYELEQLLMENQNWSERVASLKKLIEEHVRDEEESEFPELQRVLDEQKRRRMAGQMRREKAMVV
jgi:hemerythrin superfamily protein